MTHPERRRLLRTIVAGASLALTGFLPWYEKFSAWSSWLNLWGTRFPSWMVVVCGLGLAVLAFVELRGYVVFPWKLYLGISLYALLHTAAFFFFALDETPIQIGPPLAFAAFVVTGVTAVGMRPLKGKPRRRKRRKKKGPRRKPGPSR